MKKLLIGLVFCFTLVVGFFIGASAVEIIGYETRSTCDLPPVNPVHSIEITDTYIEICKASNDCRTVYYQVLPGQIANAEAVLKANFQNYFDYRQRLTSLPLDDPDRYADPAQPNLFWDQNYLVGRGIIVTDVVWMGDYFNVRLSRVFP